MRLYRLLDGMMPVNSFLIKPVDYESVASWQIVNRLIRVLFHDQERALEPAFLQLTDNYYGVQWDVGIPIFYGLPATVYKQFNGQDRLLTLCSAVVSTANGCAHEIVEQFGSAFEFRRSRWAFDSRMVEVSLLGKGLEEEIK